MGIFLFIIILVLFIIVPFTLLVITSNKKELEGWNKNNKKKFKTYLDLKEHIRTTRLYAKEDERIKEKESKKQIVKPKRESFTKTIFSRGGSLTGKIARLKKLYNNGTLTKAEFEQAKNKLLK